MPRGTRKFWPMGATPGPLFNSEGEAGGGGTPPAGAPAPEPPKPAPPAGGKADDGDKPLGPGGERALEAERTARKELERQIASIQQSQTQQRDALATALGLKPEEMSDTDKLAGQVTGLSERLEQLTRANLVLSVASEHKLSKEDAEVVSKITDEATMRAVAARLAEAAKPSGKPKADPPSSGGGSAPAVDLPGLPRLRAAYEATHTN